MSSLAHRPWREEEEGGGRAGETSTKVLMGLQSIINLQNGAVALGTAPTAIIHKGVGRPANAMQNCFENQCVPEWYASTTTRRSAMGQRNETM